MLSQLREIVAHHLDGSPWPVHHYLPDDVAEVPCIAVPRPRLFPGEQNLITGTLVVLVVGNRLNTTDAQAELDQVADLVVGRFGGVAKSVRPESPTVLRLVLDDVSPTTVLVAGQEFPVYALTVTATITPDC